MGKTMAVVCSTLKEMGRSKLAELREVLDASLPSFIEDGFDMFVSGGKSGADYEFFSSIHNLKNTYPHIQNTIVLPFKGTWSESSEGYSVMKEVADKITYEFDGTYSSLKAMAKERNVIARSDMVLFIWCGKSDFISTLFGTAKEHGKPTCILNTKTWDITYFQN